MQIKVHLLHQSKPVVIDNVRNSYQKGDLFCVMTTDGKVQKFPIVHLFRVVEEWGSQDTETKEDLEDAFSKAFASKIRR